MRDSARINSRAMASAIDEGALRAGIVVDVSADGRVALDDFSNSNGEMTWMAVMSRSFPRVGDVAVYGMIQGSPVCLGIMPNENDPYRINSPNFIYQIEHFHFLSGSLISGSITPTGLFASLSGASVLPVTAAGLGTPLQGNGWAYIATGSVLGNYGFIYQGISNISFYTLQSFEVGFMLGQTGNKFFSVALDDAPVGGPTNCLRFVCDNAANYVIAGVTNSVNVVNIDTGLAPQALKLMCVRFTKLSPGVWEVHYRYPVDQSVPVSLGIFEGLPITGNVFTSVAVYNRAAVAQAVYIDYMAWAIEGMAGVF